MGFKSFLERQKQNAARIKEKIRADANRRANRKLYEQTHPEQVLKELRAERRKQELFNKIKNERKKLEDEKIERLRKRFEWRY